MATFTKVWVGTSVTASTTPTAGNYADDGNWQPITIRNASYFWLNSGTTTEYYLAGSSTGANPGIVQPGHVQFYGDGTATNATTGALGSLTAGKWGYGDNDTLGFSTIYVRTTGSVDPDTLDLDAVTFTNEPAAGDDVRIPASTAQAISSGLKQQSIAIEDFIVEDGYSGAIGTSDEYLRVDPNRFEFAGSGVSYIDIGSAAIACTVKKTASAQAGKRGLYLKGSAISVLAADGGHTGVAARPGETATVTTARSAGQSTSLWLGEGCSLTTLNVINGTVSLRCAATTVNQYAGTLNTEEAGTIGTANIKGGTFNSNSVGTITALNHSGGTVDFTQSGRARTVTTYSPTVSDGGTVLKADTNTVTFTTYNKPSDPAVITLTKPT